jgi:PqqD family protein of HPr-rel-A system
LPPAWRLADSDRFLLQEYTDGAVLYLPHTGDTHLLRPEASHILRTLGQTPMDQTALHDRLVQAGLLCGDDPPDLEGVLGQLQSLRLIERMQA